MAEKATELKNARSQHKAKVTTTSKRLIGAIDRKADKSCVLKFLNELEMAMSDFSLIHDEYCCYVEENNLEDFKTVNGKDLEEYLSEVTQVYEDAIDKFKGNRANAFSPLLIRIDTSINRLSHLCYKSQSIIEDENIIVTSQLCATLCQQFDILIVELQEAVGQLSQVEEGDLFQNTKSKVNDVVTKCDSVKIDLNLAVCMSDKEPEAKFNLHSKLRLSLDKIDGSAETSIQNNGLPSQVQGKGDIHIKKIKLPEFSGLRKDWPEFKAIWRELAESSLTSKSALALELKRSLKGAAKEKVKHVYVTNPDAYDVIWKRLSEHYDDVSAGVSSALDCLKRLRPLRDDDYRGLVHLVDEVEGVHAQLRELGQEDVISAREIDTISELLPSFSRMVWMRTYHELEDHDKIRPLKKFLQFLVTERASVARLAENQKAKNSRSSDSNAVSLGKTSQKQSNKPSCVIHKGENVKHKTADCRDFLALSLDEKYQSLREVHACFRCFGLHRRDQCKTKVHCSICNKHSHHTLMCKQGQNSSETDTEVATTTNPRLSVNSTSHFVKAPANISLYAIQQAYIVSRGKSANVFCDNGSNTSYITHRAAEKLKVKRLDKYTLDITTMGNVSREFDTRLYEVSIRTVSGEVHNVFAFGIDNITSPVSSLDATCLTKIFPGRDVSVLQRKSANVDMLLGCDCFALHPKKEVCRVGNLSIMQGELGVCLVGSHPDLREGTKLSCNMVKVIHDQRVKVESNFVMGKHFMQPILNEHCIMKQSGDVNFISRKICIDGVNSFIEGEELATGADPKCGSCKCGKCPSVGHTYSFREEQELKLIRDNLRYCAEEKCWYTSYPWLIDPSQLPDNYNVALATLRNTERTLAKDPQWSQKYKEQIEDMLQRGVARKLSIDEIKLWDGPKNFISHLAVSNPKSQSTPVRIVFNSSQVCNGVSLNNTLAKGPDGYMNSLLGLLLRWREELVAVVGDIRKMFHSVKLESIEQHCHRFLWRDLDVSRAPDIYVMLRVNMGDTPAPAICTEALYKTAEIFGVDSQEASQMILKSTYVDDIVDSFSDKEMAKRIIEKTEEILSCGGFHIKCWLFSGETEIGSELKSDGGVTRVLGINWDSKQDAIVFRPVLNFSSKKRGNRTGANLTQQDLPQSLPSYFTRRIVLEQVMSLFDPLGLLSPFTLVAKIYLRESWALRLGWDDPLPPELYKKWVSFFEKLFHLNDIVFDRKLHPENAHGKPWLILMSDASDLAYGFAAYVRWRLSNGKYWCRLVMAKSRIAPMRKLSTPQMELNAAVLSARGRKVIEKESRFVFDKVLHLVDSETVLNMLHKTSTRFKIYEGVRIGEIQASTNGDMSEWAWLAGKRNTADWLTRGKDPNELNEVSEWWQGPSILYEELENWGIKFGLQNDATLPGEKKLAIVSVAHCNDRLVDYSRFSDYRKVRWVIARILSVAKLKSFRGGSSNYVTPELLHKADNWVVKDAQKSYAEELSNKKGSFKSLSPILDSSGIWIIGKRLGKRNPMTPEGDAQVLLPTDHVVTRMLMKDAHVASFHRGRDATLARFRMKYWTPHGSKVAWSIRNSCQLCKLREVKFLNQEMGELPESRVKPAPPFTYVMLDIFGPFKIRGEVQKRTTGKGYGVIFTDMTMRAVHIEGVFGYDTDSFLLAFSRFVSVRGWPERVYSDTGSQLVSVDRELKNVWSSLDRTRICKNGAENGLEWMFGPADAPWYQGAVEVLIKSVKRAFAFAFHGHKFSASEFLSACYEIANVLNERPIGCLPSIDAEISVLTPNCLLMGRAIAQNPGGWQVNVQHLKQFNLVQDISNSFWQKWSELCAPALVVQRKWHTATRNLKPGDVVVVADKNLFRGQYKVAKVKKVFPGQDGKVRRVTVVYKNFKVGERFDKYAGAPDTEVSRSVHKLALLVPVDEKT